jgi:ribonuclease P protein component
LFKGSKGRKLDPEESPAIPDPFHDKECYIASNPQNEGVFFMQRFRFRKSERLKSRKRIGLLFRKGRSHFKYPLKMVWQPVSGPDDPGLQVAISVPKKRVRKAVDRNRIKRQIREAWRLHKNRLSEQTTNLGLRIDILFIYVDHKEVPFGQLESTIRKMIGHLLGQIEKTAD